MLKDLVHILRECTRCTGMGSCSYVEDDAVIGEKTGVPCLCVDVIRMCVRLNEDYEKKDGHPLIADDLPSKETAFSLEDQDIIKIWEMTTTVKPTSAAEQQFEEAMGLKVGSKFPLHNIIRFVNYVL